MKFKAPEFISHFEFDNVDYQRDEDGNFEIRHPDHIAHAQLLGAVPADSFRPGLFDGAIPALAAAVPTETEEKLANTEKLLEQRESENDELRARLERLENAIAAQGTNTPPPPPPPSGDTSSSTGGTGQSEESEDKIGAALAKNPDFDGMDRDQMVDWLKSVDVSVSPSISKVNARAAITDTVNQYHASKQD